MSDDLNVMYVTTRAELVAALQSACHCDQVRIHWERAGGVTRFDYPALIDGDKQYDVHGSRKTRAQRRNQRIGEHVRNVRALDKSHFIA